MIDIKGISGIVRYSTEINKDSVYKYTLMKEEYILLKFSVDNPIFFKLGDICDIEEGLFEIIKLQQCDSEPLKVRSEDKLCSYECNLSD